MGDKFEVLVELKQEVLDTEGRAIRDALRRLGHDSIKEVRVSKRFVLSFEDVSAAHRDVVTAIAKDVLANPVSETFIIRAPDEHDQGQ